MKLILLTKGYSVQVDDEDYDWLNQWKWYFSNGYAKREVGTIEGRREKLYLHQLLCNTKLTVDHKDHDTLNCCRDNLRKATQKQQTQNKRKINTRKTSSKFKGVYWITRFGKWVVQLRKTHIGYFVNEIDAALAYNRAAQKEYGEFAVLNNV